MNTDKTAIDTATAFSILLDTNLVDQEQKKALIQELAGLDSDIEPSNNHVLAVKYFLSLAVGEHGIDDETIRVIQEGDSNLASSLVVDLERQFGEVIDVAVDGKFADFLHHHDMEVNDLEAASKLFLGEYKLSQSNAASMDLGLDDYDSYFDNDQGMDSEDSADLIDDMNSYFNEPAQNVEYPETSEVVGNQQSEPTPDDNNFQPDIMDDERAAQEAKAFFAEEDGDLGQEANQSVTPVAHANQTEELNENPALEQPVLSYNALLQSFTLTGVLDRSLQDNLDIVQASSGIIKDNSKLGAKVIQGNEKGLNIVNAIMSDYPVQVDDKALSAIDALQVEQNQSAPQSDVSLAGTHAAPSHVLKDAFSMATNATSAIVGAAGGVFNGIGKGSKDVVNRLKTSPLAEAQASEMIDKKMSADKLDIVSEIDSTLASLQANETKLSDTTWAKARRNMLEQGADINEPQNQADLNQLHDSQLAELVLDRKQVNRDLLNALERANALKDTDPEAAQEIFNKVNETLDNSDSEQAIDAGVDQEGLTKIRETVRKLLDAIKKLFNKDTGLSPTP